MQYNKNGFFFSLISNTVINRTSVTGEHSAHLLNWLHISEQLKGKNSELLRARSFFQDVNVVVVEVNFIEEFLQEKTVKREKTQFLPVHL